VLPRATPRIIGIPLEINELRQYMLPRDLARDAEVRALLSHVARGEVIPTMTTALAGRTVEGTDRIRGEQRGLPPGFRRFLTPLLSTFEPHRAVLLAARARSLAAAYAGTMPGHPARSQATPGRFPRR